PRSSRSAQRNGATIPGRDITSGRFCCAPPAASPRAADDDADLLDPIQLDPGAGPLLYSSRRGPVPFFSVGRIRDFDCLVGAHYRRTIRTPRDNSSGGLTIVGSGFVGTRDCSLFERMA